MKLQSCVEVRECDREEVEKEEEVEPSIMDALQLFRCGSYSVFHANNCQE